MSTDAHAEQLYGGDPATFVERRDALSRQLRESGQRADATAVKALRRPTVAAVALNVVARTDPELITAVLEAADVLARTQRRALSGLDADVRGAVRAHHRSIAAVIDATGPQPVAVADAVRDTLLAATLDETVADQLRRGVLARAATPTDTTAGLLGAAPLTAVRERAEALPDTAGGSDADSSSEDARAAARARVEREAERTRQRRLAQLARAVEDAERALARARAEGVATARRRRDADARARQSTSGAATAQQAVQQRIAALADAEAARDRAVANAEEAVERLQLAAEADRDAAGRVGEAEQAAAAARRELDAGTAPATDDGTAPV